MKQSYWCKKTDNMYKNNMSSDECYKGRECRTGVKSMPEVQVAGSVIREDFWDKMTSDPKEAKGQLEELQVLKFLESGGGSMCGMCEAGQQADAAGVGKEGTVVLVREGAR